MNPIPYLQNVFCDKCGKYEITQQSEQNGTSSSTPSQSLKDYNGPSMIVNAVYTMITYNLKCHACGNTKTITQ